MLFSLQDRSTSRTGVVEELFWIFLLLTPLPDALSQAVMNEIPHNVQEHAPSPAGASVDPNQASEHSPTPENTAAGDGCVSQLVRFSSLNLLLRREMLGDTPVIRIKDNGVSAVLLPEDLQELSAWLANPRSTWLMIASQDNGEPIPPTVIQGWQSPQDHSSQTPPILERKSSASGTQEVSDPASPESLAPDSRPKTIPA